MLLKQVCIKNHIYHYTTSCETAICDSGGVLGDLMSRRWKQYYFFNKLIVFLNFELYGFVIIQNTFFWSLELTRFYSSKSVQTFLYDIVSY
jgi:hypothetical protein